LLFGGTAVQDSGQEAQHVLKTWDLGRGSGVCEVEVYRLSVSRLSKRNARLS